MCGRFSRKYHWKQLHNLMELTTLPLDLGSSYNVAPTQVAPIVRADAKSDGSIGPGGARALCMNRWGLVPSWSKDAKIGNSLVNARAEGIESKPTFRAAFKRRRCLVPVSGFYEWKKLSEKSKQPYYITSSSDEEPLVFAGLWEWWKPPASEDESQCEPLETFTIITTTPNEMMAQLHNRMPVILDRADFAAWLDPGNTDAASLLGLLKPYPSELMRCWPVSTRVNSPKFNDPSCMEPVSESVPPSYALGAAASDAETPKQPARTQKKTAAKPDSDAPNADLGLFGDLTA